MIGEDDATNPTPDAELPEQLGELIARFEEASARSAKTHAADEAGNPPALSRLTQQLEESAETLRAGAELARAVAHETLAAR